MDPVAIQSFADDRFEPEVVAVFGLDGEVRPTLRFSGTAHCFGHSPWLLTAEHVISAVKRYVVARPQHPGDHAPYLIYPITAFHTISGFDAAVLCVPNMLQRPGILSLASSAVTRGTDVWMFGFPLTDETWNLVEERFDCSLAGRYLESYVTRVFRDSQAKDRPTIEIAHMLPPGISGAPIVSRPGREIVGIAQGTQWCQYQGQSYGFGLCTPVADIRDELRRITTRPA
jgi:hypothetical protein